MQLTLSKRLVVGIGAMLALVGGLSAVSIYSLTRVNESVVDLADNWLPSVQKAASAQEAMGSMRRIEFLHVLTDDAQDMAGYDKEYEDLKVKAVAAIGEYEKMISTAEERRIFTQVKADAETYFQISARMIAVSRENKKDEATKLARGESRPAFRKVAQGLGDLVALNAAGASESSAHAAATNRTANVTVLTFACAGLGVGIATGILLARSIRRPIAKVVESLEAVAGRDLTKPALEMTIDDEIGRLARATDSMSVALKTMISQVSATSNDVAAASTEVAASSEELASTVRNQEQTTGQVSSAVSELSASVTEVATKAAGASTAAQDSKKQADDGGKLVDRTVTQLGEINHRFNDVADVVTSLEKQGEEVGRIVQVIQDIADQTNLLALNAAIEAARAGEHGRGFAVVADEVRKLAERTTRATGEVSSTIGAMREGTQKAAGAMQVGRSTVEEGRTLGGQAGDSVRSIVTAQTNAEAMSTAIAAAAQQQASATEEIARSLEQMSAANAQSASAATQSSAAATNLSKQAEALKQLVGQFRV